ncbi:DUF4974 domain-containing protein [Sphingobacterium phlebotomi]|uniref:DUF4974 domain-containing protein n=1 Tax=Sphingobacterium phlebotomi TaxID=2605433 RepID=A0A5D4GZN7_9SPHI|nr:FecR family protein [Sphingobacterium phlebotomi]TYR33858.1 DUF4974 domain-containing protein [Sphingobacterium phlebotomi]
MNPKEFQQLAEKISSGMATEKEVALYNYYYDQFQKDTEWDSSVLGEKEAVERELYERIRMDLPGYKTKFRSFPFLKIVAAVVLIAISIGVLIQNQQQELSPAYTVESRLKQDVDPGTNKAVLTLSDGTVLNLDESKRGVLADQGGAQIKKLEDGEVAYTSAENPQNGNLGENVFNTITIPRGGQYQLVLPDGTKVSLNASSSLKFPVSFTGNSRVVELEGEAYFEVATVYRKNSSQRQPFIVKTSSQQIEVLGTHFNVNAYRNEEVVKTTLVEGKVRVSSIVTKETRTLNPGEQTQIAKTGHIRLLEDIDVEEVTAWKDGMFYFNNTDLATIMRQLSRWYNVEVDIDNMPQKKFNGALPRDVKLSQVLKMMETTSGLKFKIDERRISMLK